MLSYSPYDNVKAQDYPNILITAGLNDPRVAYWEPAKWAAKLRATKTDDNLLVLKTVMEGGHFGKSGRYSQLHEIAYEYAFIFDRLGMTD
jgi:oligopeptidase B